MSRVGKNYQWYVSTKVTLFNFNGTPNSFCLKAIKTITYFPKKMCDILDGILNDHLWYGTTVIMKKLDYTCKIYFLHRSGTPFGAPLY